MRTNFVNKTSPSFQGLYLGIMSTSAKKAAAGLIAGQTGQNVGDVMRLTRFSGRNRMDFLMKLADIYNANNFYVKTEQRENVNLINDIYKLVKSPSEKAFGILNMPNMSLENLKRIFSSTKNRSKYNSFVCKMHKDVIKGRQNVYQDLIPELLESKNSKSYVNNFKQYVSYLKLNLKNPEAVKELDKMLEDGTYDYKKYDDIYNQKVALDSINFKDSPIFNLQYIKDNYSESRGSLIKNLSRNINIPKDIENNGIDEELLKMYNSTNDKNYQNRIKLLKYFCDAYTDIDVETKSLQKLKSLNQLFETIDNDKHAESFSKKIVKNHIQVPNVALLNMMFAKIPSAKLDIFSDNIANILSQICLREDIFHILENEIENPFFETRYHRIGREHGYIKSQTVVSKLFTQMLNIIRIAIYNNYVTTQESSGNSVVKLTNSTVAQKAINVEQSVPDMIPTEELTKTEQTLESVVELKPAVNEELPQVLLSEERTKPEQTLGSVVELKPAVNEELPQVLPSEERTKPDQTLRSIVELKPVVSAKVAQRKAELVSYSMPVVQQIELPATNNQKTLLDTTSKKKNIRTIQKEEIRQNVLEVIGAKLGSKMFATQKDAYGKGATKMRLSMLPEIFASIVDTRKADRAVGKYRINSSNKDALELYLLINGSNKKFINYLLKKRNVDNTRMFEVKDIIAMVKKAEAKIEAEKKGNPQYKANDARKYYNRLYEAKIEQYGKVTNSRKLHEKV